MEWKIAPSLPPYRHRPSARLGPMLPTAPPPWHPRQLNPAKKRLPSSTAELSAA
jgi:hypothetical protein